MKALICAAALPFLPATAAETSRLHAFIIEPVAEGLEFPWGAEKLPDGRILVTERPGRIRIIENGKLLDQPVGNVPPVYARGQGGLLDIRLHPEYAKNGWIYLAYSKPLENGGLTSIIRAKLRGHALENIETVFDPPADEATNAPVHFGCRIVFDGDGHLYFSIGDRGHMPNAQDLSNYKGKVHRIRDDGRIPEDNPFTGRKDARPTIWTYGNRNAQGLAFEPGSRNLWETEHGPRGGDELNLLRPGANYGWPVISYGINYDGSIITDKTEQEGMEQPVHQWTPSIAVCGVAFYTRDAFPRWKGNLFAAALAHKKLVRIELRDGAFADEEILLEGSGRIRDVRCFDDGAVTVIYDTPGRIVRLVPTQ